MTIQLRKILLPTDFSRISAAATTYACELATKFDTDLHLLHILELHLSSTPNFGLELPQNVSESKASAEKSMRTQHRPDRTRPTRTGGSSIPKSSCPDSHRRKQPFLRQHFLNSFFEPHGQRSFLPSFSVNSLLP
jgi:Universal stress protein family